MPAVCTGELVTETLFYCEKAAYVKPFSYWSTGEPMRKAAPF